MTDEDFEQGVNPNEFIIARVGDVKVNGEVYNKEGVAFGFIIPA